MQELNYNPYNDFENIFPRQLKRIYTNTETPTDKWEEKPLNLCDVCLDVRSQYNGASDPWDRESLLNTQDMINRRLLNWNRSREDVMDVAVYTMCVQALYFIALSLQERKDWKEYVKS